VVEFLGVALVLLVPIVYLVLALGRLQAAAFAVDGAAREAVRVVVAAAADPRRDAGASAQAAARIALADQGVEAADPVALTCDPACDAPGAEVAVRVEVAVDLPLIPSFVRDRVPLAVPVSAGARGRVDEFLDVG
jgi:hypothetical protein